MLAQRTQNRRRAGWRCDALSRHHRLGRAVGLRGRGCAQDDELPCIWRHPRLAPPRHRVAAGPSTQRRFSSLSADICWSLEHKSGAEWASAARGSAGITGWAEWWASAVVAVPRTTSYPASGATPSSGRCRTLRSAPVFITRPIFATRIRGRRPAASANASVAANTSAINGESPACAQYTRKSPSITAACRPNTFSNASQISHLRVYRHRDGGRCRVRRQPVRSRRCGT